MTQITLSGMSGEDFEKICREIFEKYYNVQVERTPLVNDKGKDLIIHLPNGIIFVECKCFGKNVAVGRPVVQKLDSAIMREHASGGMIVTTGYFAAPAAEYVRDNRLNIKLIDFAQLKAIAHSAGFELVADRDDSNVTCVLPRPKDEFQDNVVKYISSRVLVDPSQIHVKSRQTEMCSYYRVNYSVDAIFSTSIGIIHEEKASGSLLLHGTDLSPTDPKLAQYYAGARESSFDAAQSRIRVETGAVKILSEVREAGLNEVIHRHTCTVKYQGKNRTEYIKDCVPLRKDVVIRGIDHIYLPKSAVGYEISGRRRSLNVFDGKDCQGIFAQGDGLGVCDICRQMDSGKLGVCQYCGNLFHPHEHGFVCSQCGNSFCINCGGYRRKYLVMKKPYCQTCAQKDGSFRLKRY